MAGKNQPKSIKYAKKFWLIGTKNPSHPHPSFLYKTVHVFLFNSGPCRELTGVTIGLPEARVRGWDCEDRGTRSESRLLPIGTQRHLHQTIAIRWKQFCSNSGWVVFGIGHNFQYRSSVHLNDRWFINNWSCICTGFLWKSWLVQGFLAPFL